MSRKHRDRLRALAPFAIPEPNDPERAAFEAAVDKAVHRTGRSSVLASPHGRRSPRTKNRPWLAPSLKSAIESPCSGLTSRAPPGGVRA